MAFQRVDRNSILILVIIEKIVEFNTSKVKCLAHIVLILQIFNQLFVVYLPAETFRTAIKEVRRINESIVSHRAILPAVQASFPTALVCRYSFCTPVFWF